MFDNHWLTTNYTQILSWRRPFRQHIKQIQIPSPVVHQRTAKAWPVSKTCTFPAVCSILTGLDWPAESRKCSRTKVWLVLISKMQSNKEIVVSDKFVPRHNSTPLHFFAFHFLSLNHKEILFFMSNFNYKHLCRWVYKITTQISELRSWLYGNLWF